MVGVRLAANSAVHFEAGLRRSQSRQRWYLAVLVIRTNFRRHQGSVAVFGSTSKAPVGVTHGGADYTTLRPWRLKFYVRRLMGVVSRLKEHLSFSPRASAGPSQGVTTKPASLFCFRPESRLGSSDSNRQLEEQSFRHAVDRFGPSTPPTAWPHQTFETNGDPRRAIYYQ